MATEEFNPKSTINGGAKAKRKMPVIFATESPIPGEVTDTGNLKAVFEKYKLVPFAKEDGKTGHSLLLWYIMLAKLSPTNASCIQKKNDYAFGRVTLKQQEDIDWYTGAESIPISAQQQADLQTTIKEMITFEGGAVNLHKHLGWNYQASGNAWLELSVSTVNGQTRANLKSHRLTHVLYVATEMGEARKVAISPIWTDEYLKKNTPRIVPIFPVFTQEDGVFRTMLHLKAGEGEWYGRPESQGADLYKYNEVQQAIYQIKQAAGNFTGQLILEVEDDDPANAPAIDDDSAQSAGFDSFAQRFEQNFTAKADNPQSVLVTSRPYGSKPMFAFQVKPNTNENWYKVTGEIASGHIMRNNGCTPRFMGVDVSNGFSANVYFDDYIVNMEPVLDSFRNTVCALVNTAISSVWLAFANMPQMNDYSLTFIPPIAAELAAYRLARLNAQSPPAVQSAQASTTPQTP